MPSSITMTGSPASSTSLPHRPHPWTSRLTELKGLQILQGSALPAWTQPREAALLTCRPLQRSCLEKQQGVTGSHAADWPKCQSLISPTVRVLELGDSQSLWVETVGTNAFKKKAGKFLSLLFVFRNRVPLCSPWWPPTSHLPAPASGVQELLVWATYLSSATSWKDKH